MRRKLLIVPALLLFFVGLQPASGLSSDWQPRAAINAPGDEETQPWSATQAVAAGSLSGLEVSVLPGAEHTLHVTGTYQFQTWAGTARLADALCAVDHYDPAAGPSWQKARWDHLVHAGWLDLKVRDGGVVRDIAWEPVGSDPAVPVDPGCSSTHHYTAKFVPQAASVHFFVSDPWTEDTHGQLDLTVSGPGWERPYQCGKRTEEAVVDVPGDSVGEIHHAHVTVDSRRSTDDFLNPADAKNPDGTWQIDHWNESGHWGIYTCNWALPTSKYRVTVTGTFRYAFTENLKTRRAMADAECARDIDGNRRWWTNFYEPTAEADDILDLYVNRKAVDWKPLFESKNNPGCSDLHMYVLEDWSPQYAGPVHLKIYDSNYAEFDNIGDLHVMIERVGPDAPQHSELFCSLGTHVT
jgi:hypothetical protein